MLCDPAGLTILKPWSEADAEWYVQARDELIFQWTTERRNLTVAETRVAIQAVNANPLAHSFAITESGSSTKQGNITLAIEPENQKQGEVMYWLAPAGRGRGLATQALTILCRWAFEALALETIVLKTLPQNTPSQRVAERAGFQRLWRPGDREHVWFVLSNPKR